MSQVLELQVGLQLIDQQTHCCGGEGWLHCVTLPCTVLCSLKNYSCVFIKIIVSVVRAASDQI